jgi:hypothetical protein
MRFRSLALALATLVSPAAAEDDFGLLHITNANLELTAKTTLQLHTRVRTYQDSRQFFQFRTGPILIHQFTPRVGGLAGYYYMNQDNSSAAANTRVYRLWAGPQFRLLDNRRFAIDTRHLAERFAVSGKDDYTRIRNRAMLICKAGALQPFASVEALMQNGDWYERHAIGIQIQTRSQVTYGIGYEYRASPTGPGIHLIATSIQFRAWRNGDLPHID